MTKKAIIIVAAIGSLAAILGYWFYPRYSSKIRYHDPELYGIVATEQTACQIAEAVWLQVYGDVIYNSRPFNATLKDSVWIVQGTLHFERGGTPYMEISKRDGKILKIVHYK